MPLRLPERPLLPRPPLGVPRPLAGFLGALLKHLSRAFTETNTRANASLPQDGLEAMRAPLVLRAYTTATRPTASDWAGGAIYVSDGAAGSKFQGSDGSAWVSLG